MVVAHTHTHTRVRSLPALLWYSALGHYPYSNNGVYFDLMQDIVTGDVPVIPVSNYSESIRSFVGKCLRKDPESRSTTTALLSHPFVDVDDNDIARAGEWIVRKMARGS